MGIYDRDYYRKDSEASVGLLAGRSLACKRLIAVNVAVYILQVLTLGEGHGVTAWLELQGAAVFQSGQVWRVLTYAFCHDPESPMHIVFNMLFLWWFGGQVEAIYGPREFVKFYLTAAVLSGVCFLAFNLAIGQVNPVVGASGAVMAVSMVCAMYYPRQVIYVMFILPVELRWLVTAYVVWDLYPVLRALGGGADQLRGNVAHAAHLGGLLYGFLYKHYDLRFTRLFSGAAWSGMRLPRRSSPVKLYRPPDEGDLDRQLDEILAKISEQGESSLTDREREFLRDASRRYKER